MVGYGVGDKPIFRVVGKGDPSQSPHLGKLCSFSSRTSFKLYKTSVIKKCLGRSEMLLMSQIDLVLIIFHRWF